MIAAGDDDAVAMEREGWTCRLAEWREGIAKLPATRFANRRRSCAFSEPSRGSNPDFWQAPDGRPSAEQFVEHKLVWKALRASRWSE